MHIAVKSLPQSLQSALSALGYSKRDIAVKAAESISPLEAGGQGLRGVFCAVNMETGERSVTYGSWGGANA